MTTGLENFARLGVFSTVFAAMAVWEALTPRRRLTVSKGRRWFANLALQTINALVGRAMGPLASVGIAVLAEENAWGIFNNVVMPEWAAVLVAVVVLDFAVYLQHVLFHAVPVLWRLHMVHHSDLDFDVTTGLRFHTIEIVLSMGIKTAVVFALGASVLSVVIFEVLLNATSMFNHGNVGLPPRLERLVRLFLVTPDMHRVHHSVVPSETNSNFGFSLPWWDRLLGTYRALPAEGHDGMTVGLSQFRDDRVERLHRLLLLPFTGSVGRYPINSQAKRDSDSAGTASGHEHESPARPEGARAASADKECSQ